ncbi:SusE domain-containing protein [Olleya namhaensis]|uniref:SusE domain-containing protein n=1 Tax=Olleya namhaensis TaxID=1144750 RepID=UPI00232B5E86|nr:SusE domain-containing protein [Olleya namhaensis]
MKKLINNSITLLALLFVLVSCDDNELTTLNSDVNTELSVSEQTLVLTEELAETEVLTLNWTDPDYGFNAAANYKILIDFTGGDFSAPQSISAGSDLVKILLGQEINSKLLSLGIVPNTATDIDFKIQTTFSEGTVFTSNVKTVNITAYSSLLDLSTNLGLVGDATPGGWDAGTDRPILDVPFYTTSTPNQYVAYATLRDGEMKFRKDNLWTENYGDDGADGSVEPNGANIPVTAGTYKITVMTDDAAVPLSYTLEPFSWGIVGDGTPNGWDGPDTQLTYNSFQDNFKLAVTLTDGEMKFRFNNDWGVNLGDDGLDGLLEVGGGNIPVTAGHYILTLDLNAQTYELEPMDVWGLVGDAAPNGWDGPNVKFLPDFGINEGFYYINGVTLTDGEIKIRQNDAWGLNYGDDGNDGTMEVGGANIPVTAGIYNIVFDFSGADPMISLNQW